MALVIEDGASSRWSELVSAEFILPTLTVSIGVVLFAFNAFLVSTALPSAVTDLGGGHLIAWAFSIYLVFAIATGAAAATVMQRIGARRLFILAALIFLAGICVTGSAPNMAVLLFGRTLQGVGAGFIEAGCYVLIPRLFPSRLIPKVFGVDAAAWAIAACGGPALSGFLAEFISWRASFLSSLPLALAFIVLVPRVVRDDAAVATPQRLPWRKLLAIVAGMALVVVADGATLPGAKLALVLGGGIVFWWVVRRDSSHPPSLFPSDAFHLSSPVGLGLWTALLMPVAEASVAVFLVYTLQFLWGYTALAAGLLGAILALSWSTTQLLAGNITSRSLRLHFIWVGPILLLAGYCALMLALWHQDVLLMIAAQVALGAAFGISWGSLNQVSMEAAPTAERDITSGLLPTVLSAGHGIGAALFGLIGNMLDFSIQSGTNLRDTMIFIFALACIPALAALSTAFRMVQLLLQKE